MVLPPELGVLAPVPPEDDVAPPVPAPLDGALVAGADACGVAAVPPAAVP